MPGSSSHPPTTSSAASESARVLAGRYRLERRLAQGGMAEVWVATDVSLDRKVALKWLKPSLATDPVVAERFRREAVAVAGLAHPNIVAVHDVFEDEGRQAVVMQLVDGKSLRQLLDVQTRLSPELTIHIGNCVAAALDAAHQAGFVHRDVKPGNILITADGRVMLTDFGIAKGLDASGEDLTSDNVMMGTAKYLSPEQVRGRKLDGRADLYSLGLVLYECLAGRVPFIGETDADTALARLQRDPTDLGRLRPTLPRGLVNLIHQLLSRNPAERPESGAALRTDLQRVANEPPPDLTPAEPPPGPVPSAVGPYTRAPSANRRSGRDRPPDPLTGRTAAVRAVAEASARTIPGEATPPNPMSRRSRDRTPPAGPALRGRPARGRESRPGPPLIIVVALLLVGLLVALILWATAEDGDGTATSATTPDPGTAVAAPAVAAIATVDAYDPNSADGLENNEQAPGLATGGSWATSCYANRYLGKPGVGVVMTMTQPTTGTVSFHVAGEPFQIDVFATADEAIPGEIDADAWGEAVNGASPIYREQPATLEVPIPTAARHVLILFREIGADAGCSGRNPFRSTLSALTFTP
ncbi:MAG: protein kinase domain-containing protein [Desertimonas sp.]